MAVSGFEGFEKRLELHFFGDDPTVMDQLDGHKKNKGLLGLRLLDFDSLQLVLRAVQCTVVSAVGNHYFDSYVLSESSLFVYPGKIIIKTCGTTQLLKSVRPLIHHARHLGLSLSSVRYTRGNFIFPESQPFPHTSFKEEVVYLEDSLPKGLRFRKASVMPSKTLTHSWHVFTASTDIDLGDVFTIEICMTELDKASAGKFFRRPADGKSGDSAGKDMTEATGIGSISPSALICDFAFDPCGYSMNGIDGDRYSTIHVTPEDGYSYASFETVASRGDDVARVLKKVAQVFRPATMSVSTTSASREVWGRVASALEPLGLKRRSCAVDEFPATGTVVYQTFSNRRK
ncbi:S-adenosylmethionine decarboxylase, conserved site [Parasponia andersonii]|uniref:S-adenosylmethionine decarboxylase proenzyme n=1 Tax=Parasponia andersonii TaxID=3476 RepID=A0A2P5E3V7_PARAD|nr:S-adenosylmethionine decarboxylase, conserved site [Parasponia andersonii]